MCRKANYVGKCEKLAMAGDGRAVYIFPLLPAMVSKNGKHPWCPLPDSKIQQRRHSSALCA